jgi:Fis family transcriptional regulator
LKRELDSLVAHMQASGITYAEGVREFKKRFILEVLARHHLNPAQIRHGLKRPPRGERPALAFKQTIGS